MLPIESLQRWLRENQLQGMIVSASDEYQNEFVPACARRLSWATRFSGPAGCALVLQSRAALFVDGRCIAQASVQAPSAFIDVLEHNPATFQRWLAQYLEPGGTLAFDPSLHTLPEIEPLRRQLRALHCNLQQLSHNPIDALWRDRPEPLRTPVECYPMAYAGFSCADKRAAASVRMLKAGFDYYLLTAPEEIAWLLNIRAADLPTVPVALSYALLHKSGDINWFIDPRRLPAERDSHFGDGVSIHPPHTMEAVLGALGSGLCIAANLKRTPYKLVKTLEPSGRVVDSDMIELAKAVKNASEIDAAKAAQRYDCLAVIKCLCWLDTNLPQRTLTEADVAAAVTDLRYRSDAFTGVSFEPLSASGPNAALAHYRAGRQGNRTLNGDAIYLLDSGGQYYGGTTDICRTVAIGPPEDRHKRAYTLVLKGHIALARCRFPAGTSGTRLDALARQFLWQQGMDYAHESGHGVGSYLGVHEGPAAIGADSGAAALREGMIVSNGPGYYQRGEFGIRIENLLLVKKSPLQGFLEFETLSHVPMEHRLVAFELLAPEERGWLKRYHCEIKMQFPAQLTDAEKQWLADAIEPFIEL